MNRVTRVMIISIVTNTFLSFIKIIVGYIGKSGALIADGIHSISDLTTDFFAIIGNLFSKKPADQNHPYGHGKLEYLTSIGIGAMILFVGFSIIYNAINGTIVVPTILVAVVSFVTIIAKWLLAEYIPRKGRQYQNSILMASGHESKTDVISSIVVLISSIVSQFANYFPILKYSDLVASICVGIFIIKVGFEVLKENMSAILGEQETNEALLNHIRTLLLAHSEVLSVDNLVMLKYGSYHKLIAEIGMDGTHSLADTHRVADCLEKEIITSQYRVRHVTIHVNPIAINENI